MKLTEKQLRQIIRESIIQIYEEELNEGKLARAIGTAALGAGLMFGHPQDAKAQTRPTNNIEYSQPVNISAKDKEMQEKCYYYFVTNQEEISKLDKKEYAKLGQYLNKHPEFMEYITRSANSFYEDNAYIIVNTDMSSENILEQLNKISIESGIIKGICTKGENEKMIITFNYNTQGKYIKYETQGPFKLIKLIYNNGRYKLMIGDNKSMAYMGIVEIKELLNEVNNLIQGETQYKSEFDF